MRELGEKPLIQWSIDGLKALPGVTPIVVTSKRHVDDPLVEIAKKNAIPFFRGSLENIALRVRNCLDYYGIENFARINGDCPFLNCALLKEGFDRLLSSNDYDIVTNLIPRAFPYGMSIEIFRSQIFIDHYQNLIPDFQEHITSWFYNNIELFRVFRMQYPFGNDHEIRVVVDTQEDLETLNQFLSQHPDLDIPKLPLSKIIERLKYFIKTKR